MCKCICVSTYAHTINGGLKVDYKPSYRHTCINTSVIGAQSVIRTIVTDLVYEKKKT